MLMWGQPPPAVRRVRALLWRQEDAAGITQPDAVRRPAVKMNVGGKGVGAFENVARLSCRSRVLHDQVDALVFRQIADDLGIDPRDRLELLWPVILMVRPGEPSRRMGFPFRRHAVAVADSALRILRG